jgi:methyltransferase (TIGR00027 family)
MQATSEFQASSTEPITHVMDTALWVATYRAQEDERPDRLFSDRFAKILVGDAGPSIASRMPNTRQAAWSVVIRTHVIDQLIHDAIARGADCVVNLGAGLDTRPYRMNLPKDFRWIEVDFPKMVNFKNSKLANENPICNFSRLAVDLSSDEARKAFLSTLRNEGRSIVALTEGVLPYLEETNVANLAKEMKEIAHVNEWICDYFSTTFYSLAKSSMSKTVMKNAPFVFQPSNFLAFFAQQGWKKRNMTYLIPEGIRLGRKIDLPWYKSLMVKFTTRSNQQEIREMMGYVVLQNESDR